MKLKKLISRTGLGIVTAVIVVVGGAAFSAFEAHIINVTATIENALTVPVEKQGLSFGTVFPEEVLNQNFDVNLSDSFQREPSVDDVSYMIRQKPKCASDADPNVHPPVLDNQGSFACPAGSTMMPLLCPYLSKHETTTDGTAPGGENDGTGIDAYHGLPGPWTLATTISTEVLGHLAKSQGDTSDTWNIDLHVPPFRGQVAQADTIDPVYYLDPADEHKVFGCDLWVEVTDISLPNNHGTLNVTKVVEGSNAPATDFSFTVDGGTSIPFEADGSNALVVDAGAHIVAEPAVAGYSSVISGDCDTSGNVTVPDQGVANCTITNTFQAPTILTVIKHVDNTGGGTAVAGDFTMTVTGTSPSPASFAGAESPGTDVTLSPGAYSVAETGPAGYAEIDSADCAVTIAASEHKTCTITNSFQHGTITLTKVVSDPGQLGTSQVPANFQLQIDGVNAAQGTPITVATGTHTVTEVDSHGDTVAFSVDCNSSGQVTVGNGVAKNCTVTNTVPFFTVTVTKVVNNVNGGNNVVSDFNLFVGSTQVTSGVPKNVSPGTYLISESGVAGYDGVFSGDCDSSTQLLTGANGQTKLCTITNTDIKPNITLVKHVVGGTASATDFIMRIDGVNVSTGSSKSVTSNGTGHVITEDSFSGSTAGYVFTSMTGTGSQGSVCPTALGDSVTLKEGEAITCTITNTHQ